MRQVIISRLLQFVITLIGVTFFTFSLAYLAPGDPVQSLLETAEHAIDPAIVEEFRSSLGLNDPFFVQYGRWLWHALQGNLGVSYQSNIPVVSKLMSALPGTAYLASIAMILILCTSIPLGVLAARYKGSWLDHCLRGWSFVVISLPGFWLGLLLLYFFGVKLRMFPIGTAEVNLHNAILPAVTLAITLGGKYIRQVRAIILEEYNKDYVVGARARGFSESYIMWKQVLPNALAPIVTLFGMCMGYLLGGVAVIEIVFAWPGLGRLAVTAIGQQDYPVVEGVVLWIAVAYMTINFIVDMSYYWLQPKLRQEGHYE